MYQLENKNILMVSIGKTNKSLRLASHKFSHNTLYIIHTKIKNAENDKRMQELLLQNLHNIKNEYPHAQFIEIDLYNFYYNVSIFRSYFIKHHQQNIICDITGGDKIVTDAIIYARILENQNNKIALFYQKRHEDVDNIDNSFILLPNLPSLTKKQKEIINILKSSTTIDELCHLMHMTKNNMWNFLTELKKKNLINIQQKKIITSSIPHNFYNINNQKNEMQSYYIHDILHKTEILKSIINTLEFPNLKNSVDDLFKQIERMKNDHTI